MIFFFAFLHTGMPSQIKLWFSENLKSKVKSKNSKLFKTVGNGNSPIHISASS